jgi:hypothetical protein
MSKLTNMREVIANMINPITHEDHLKEWELFKDAFALLLQNKEKKLALAKELQ